MDIALHYTERGSGSPLILLHGNGEDSTYFAHQIPYLAARFRVVAVDTRGHGASPRGEAPFTLDQFAEDLCNFMDAHDISSAHLFGFSDGGNIALLFALRYPERVLSLVLNGANLFPEGIADDVRKEDLKALAQAQEAGDTRAEELLRLMTDEPHIDPAALSVMHVPTLVIAGSDDMITEEHTRLIARSIPQARLRFVEGSHFVAVENPTVFNQALGDFYHDDCGL